MESPPPPPPEPSRGAAPAVKPAREEAREPAAPDAPRIPQGLGERDYAPVWDAIARVPEHAFELVDESADEAALDASGAQIAPHLARGLDLGEGDVVLEIGCGVARIGRHLAPRVGEWWGLDVSARMVELARRRCAGLPNVKLFTGGGADLAPIPDASVDKAYCHAVFIHMDKEDWYAYLCEARRVLVPGGLFYFDVWNLCDDAGWLRWQMERALYAGRAERPVHRNQFSTPSEVRAMLRHAGLAELALAETFCVHALAARPPEGADPAAALAALRARHAERAAGLRYGAGDYRHFTATLAARLRERGFEPEVDVTRWA